MVRKKSSSSAEAAQRSLDLLQELIWAISSRNPKELEEGLSYLKLLSFESQGPLSRKIPTSRQSVRALVGVMPLILADQELFPSNEDIAKFAHEALGIQIPRWDKRSRYEMIGMLVMETIGLQGAHLRGVTRLLERISGGGKQLDVIKRRARQTGFSWNEAIRSLSHTVD